MNGVDRKIDVLLCVKTHLHCAFISDCDCDLFLFIMG